MECNRDKVGKDSTHLPPGADSRTLWLLGEMVAYKITSDQTGGAYSLFEVKTPPGSGAPPHVQHREDEAFYVLEGEYEFLIEGRTINAGPGSLIYVPKGNLHAHTNFGEGMARMLLSQTPGVCTSASSRRLARKRRTYRSQLVPRIHRIGKASPRSRPSTASRCPGCSCDRRKTSTG